MVFAGLGATMCFGSTSSPDLREIVIAEPEGIEGPSESLPLASASSLTRILAARGGACLMVGASAEVLAIWWCWAEIKLAVGVLRSTFVFLSDAPWVSIVYPALFACANAAGLGLWSLSVLGVTELFQAQGGLGRMLREEYAPHVLVGSLFCYFWGTGIINGLSSFATARLTAEWYFAEQRLKKTIAQPRRALDVVSFGLRKHGGSFALGSLLLAIIKILNLLFFWSGRNHIRQPDDSWLRRAWLGLREVVAGCLEAVERFASKQAYVEVAISGCSFLTGARLAAQRLAGAPKRFAVVETVGAMQRMMSEVLLIAFATLLSAWACAVRAHGDETCIQDLVRVALPACFGAWLVAESMLHPVSVATTTILHCWLVEGCAAHSAHVPSPLRSLLKEEDVGAFAQHYA